MARTLTTWFVVAMPKCRQGTAMRSNQSIEPTRVDRHPFAAQLQR
jgi:hypothetical protein